MQFPSIDCLVDKVLPSIEVQAIFKSQLPKRIKAVATVSLTAVGVYALMNPITFQAVVISTILTFVIGSLFAGVLSAYQCRSMSYDEDAEERAKQISSDKEGQLCLLMAIKRLRKSQRDWFLSFASALNRNLNPNYTQTDYHKYLIIQSLNMASSDMLNQFQWNLQTIKSLLQITPYALSLYILVGITKTKVMINHTNNFLEDEHIKAFLLEKLKGLNEEMSKKIHNLSLRNSLDVAKDITMKSEIDHRSVLEYLLHYKFYEAHLAELGLNTLSPDFQENHRLVTELVALFNESTEFLETARKLT